jgi:hypothetical protein
MVAAAISACQHWQSWRDGAGRRRGLAAGTRGQAAS